nr:MAG TPA: hypothetical protein [Caudoviricetes sp.]
MLGCWACLMPNWVMGRGFGLSLLFICSGRYRK